MQLLEKSKSVVVDNHPYCWFDAATRFFNGRLSKLQPCAKYGSSIFWFQPSTLSSWSHWPRGPVDLKSYWPPGKSTGPHFSPTDVYIRDWSHIKLLEPLAQGASRFEKLLAPRKIYWPPFFPDRRLYSWLITHNEDKVVRNSLRKNVSTEVKQYIHNGI